VSVLHQGGGQEELFHQLPLVRERVT
jgi:hypothetical protein